MSRPTDPPPVVIGTNPDDTRRKKPCGRCHDCQRPISGERRLCGVCAARRERFRSR